MGKILVSAGILAAVMLVSFAFAASYSDGEMGSNLVAGESGSNVAASGESELIPYPRFSPDLVSYVSFQEFGNSTNSTNSTNGTRASFVTVTTRVFNWGFATAGPSTTMTYNPITGMRFVPTPSLSWRRFFAFSQTYPCSFAHTFTAQADYYDVVRESNEANNGASAFIDCIL